MLIQGSNFSSHTRKMRVEKAIGEVEFLYFHFLAGGKLRLLSAVLILDINLLSSFLKCRSLTVAVFVFIHRKTLSMEEVNIGYNLNAQTHTITPQHGRVSANHMLSNFRL